MAMKSVYQGVVATLLGAGLMLASNAAEAANCTISNWSSAVGLADSNAGTQGSGNRRYAGPCGLRVPLGGTEAYLQDGSPATEEAYNVRFYFFLNSVTNDVTIFQAENASSVDVISATYDASEQKVNVVFSVGLADGSQTSTVTTAAISSGWNSLEIQWASNAATKPKVILNANAAVEPSANVNTSNFKIDVAKLGAISGQASVPTGGSIDFDDFDSRRDTVPGRLMRGDATSDGAVNSQDFVQVINEITGASTSAGQPDCTEDGAVNSQDFVCIINVITGQ